MESPFSPLQTASSGRPVVVLLSWGLTSGAPLQLLGPPLPLVTAVSWRTSLKCSQVCRMSIVRAFITRILQESKSSLPTSLTPGESGLLVAQGLATCSAGNMSLEQS